MRPPLFQNSDIARISRGEILSGDPSAAVSGFAIDTRKVLPGDAFVAFEGERTDGHRFLPQASQAGAVTALVTRRDTPATTGLCLIAVEDAVLALQELATAHRNRFQIPLVGVTGSNGKTTTRSALETVLSAGLRVCASRGNFNNHIGLPLSLFALDETHQAGVFELGMSHLGEIAVLTRILRPEIGVITNVAPAHLEGLGTLDNVIRAKGELAEALPEEGRLFLNRDCPNSTSLASMTRAQSSGVRLRKNGADAWVSDLQVELARLSGTIHVRHVREPAMEIPFDLPLSGRHMAYPLIFAAAVAAHLGLDEQTIRGGIAAFRPAQGRMDIGNRGGVQVIDDCYNANPASTDAALDHLEEAPVSGKRYAVLGDMLELGEESGHYHRKVAARCLKSTRLEQVYLFGEEFRAALAGDEPTGRVQRIDDKDRISSLLAERLQKGDCLLVKGSRGVALETVLEKLFGAGDAA